MCKLSRLRAVFAAFGLFALATGPLAAQDIAVVIKVKGTVTYQPPGVDAWIAATQGLTLVSGSKLRSAADGLAMVKFLADGSMMRLKPETYLTLAVRDKKNAPTLSLGAALFEVTPSKKPADFTVTTPTGVAAVKGTRFWVTVRQDSTTVVACLDGVVSVSSSSSGATKEIKPGTTALCSRSGVTARATQTGDIPSDESTQRLQFQFRAADGTTRSLDIESTPSK